MCWFLRKYYAPEHKAEVTQLTDTLIKIGNKEGYLSERSGGPFDQNCRNSQARQIGARFFEIGGVPLMEERLKRIAKKCGKEAASHLDACWRAVGGIF